MKRTTTIRKGDSSAYLLETHGLFVDRIRAGEGNLSSGVKVPRVPLISLARVVRSGVGEFDIINDYVQS